VGWAGSPGSVLATAKSILGGSAGFLDTLTRPRPTTAAFLGPGGAYHVVASIRVVLLAGSSSWA
jgi:hypothetical protein